MEQAIIKLYLTPEQTEQVNPYLDSVSKGMGAIFMVASESYEPDVGKSVVKAELAYLEIEQAIKILNAIRKLFGKRPLPYKKKKAEQTEQK